MSKITRLVRHLAVVAIASLCAQCAWAAEYQLTNATLPQNQANYDNKTLTLTLPVTAAVPSDTVVSVTTIKIGIAGHSTAGNLPRFPDKIAINEATSAAGTYADDSAIGSGAGWMTYAFETAVELKVGTAYTITCYNSSDETIDDFRFRVADYNGLSDPKIIAINGETRYAPFCTVIGTYESSMPTSTFAFTGNASGGSASGFTISGEGGDATKKTVGPAGTQVPMIYFVSNSDKWHPWANFTAKDTFTLAAYVNTSSCTPAEGKNGVIWSMGNSGGNRVMLVKSSDGKIKLITASGANITNESTAPAFDETAGYHLYTASFSTTDGLKLTVDADTANTKSDSTATTKAADGFQIGSIFQGLQTAKFEVGNNIGVANLIGYDVVLSDSQIPVLAETYPAAAMTIKSDIHQDTANKEVVLFPATTDGNHFIGVSKGTMTIPVGAEVSVPHIRCINNNATADRATFNVAGTVNVTSESTDPNVWSDRLSYKGVLFGHYHGQGTYNITGTLSAPNTYVELCYTAEAQTLNVNGGTITTKGIHSNNGQGTINLSNDGRIALSTSTFMNVPVTVTGGTIAANETATYAKQLTVSSGELALEVAAEKTLILNGGVSNSGTISVKSGTVVIPAGSEGTVTITEGATLKLMVTDAQIATGYTATNVTGDGIVFVNAAGETLESEGNSLAPAAIVWTGDVDGNWNTDGNWSTGSAPTAEAVVTIKKDASITMASDSTYQQLFIESNVTFAGTINHSTMHDIFMSDTATMTINVASGEQKIRHITGGKIIKTGNGVLSVANNTSNQLALDGTTVDIRGGVFLPNNDSGADADMLNPTFIIGESGELKTYGWTTVRGTLTIESDSNKDAFINNGGYGGKIKGGPAIVKNGSGVITLRAGSDANFGAITVNGGRLDFGSNQPTIVGGAISGSGAIGVNGSGLVTLNGNSNNGYTGGTVITSGTLKLGTTNALGGQGKTVTVLADGVLDVNGIENHGAVLTLAGGKVTNPKAVSEGNVQFRSITLTEDSTIDLTAKTGIINNGYGATTLDLGGHTLTKTGDGDLILCNVTVKNPGLIDMKGGAINRNGRTLSFDMTGVSITEKTTLVKYPEGTTASIDGMQLTNNANGYTLKAEDNLIVIEPPILDVTIAIQTVDHMDVAVTVGGEAVTITDGAITIAPGTTFTVTYTPQWGYCGSAVSTDYTAGAQVTVTAPEAPAAAVAQVVGGAFYATVDEALANIGSSQFVTLLADVTTSTITVPENFYGAINLNGHTITRTVFGSYVLKVPAGAYLELGGNGGIVNSAAQYPYAIENKGTIVLRGINVTGMVTTLNGGWTFVEKNFKPTAPVTFYMDWNSIASVPYLAVEESVGSDKVAVSYREFQGTGAEVYHAIPVTAEDQTFQGLQDIYTVHSISQYAKAALVTKSETNATIDILSGTYELNNATTADQGDTVTFTVTPAENYVLSSVTVNGEAVSPDAEGVYSITVGEAVAIAAVAAVPEKPTASVADLADAPEGVEGAHTFTAVAPTATQAAYYGDWNADFIVTFSRAMAAGEVTLTGQSDHHSTEWVDLDVGAVAANTGIPLIAAVLEQTGWTGVQVTYDFVCNTVGTFNCGVKNNLAVGAEAATMTVQLVLSKGTETLPIGDPIEYTLTAPTAPTRPTEVEGGSTAQKAAYDAWAKGQNLSGLTNAQIIDRFIFNVGADASDEDLEDALDEVIEKTDCFAKLMAEIAKGIDPTAYTFTLEVYPNATFKFVEVPETEIKTSAKLFRLTATFVPANDK